MLQGVISVKAVELLREMEGGVMHPGIPRLQQNERRLWHETTPLLRIEEHDDEEKASNNEPVHIEEMP